MEPALTGTATETERRNFIRHSRVSHDALPPDLRADLARGYRRAQAEGTQRRQLARHAGWNNPDWTNR